MVSIGNEEVIDKVHAEVTATGEVETATQSILNDVLTPRNVSQHLFGGVSGVTIYGYGTMSTYKADADRRIPYSKIAFGSSAEAAAAVLMLDYSAVTTHLIAAIRDSKTNYDPLIIDLSKVPAQYVRLSEVFDIYNKMLHPIDAIELENWPVVLENSPTLRMKEELTRFENWVDKKLIKMFDLEFFYGDNGYKDLFR